MSRTAHARGRAANTTRMWLRRNAEHDLPIRDRRKLDTGDNMTTDELAEIKAKLEDLDSQVGALETDIACMIHCGAPTERDEQNLDTLLAQRAELHRQSGARLEYDAKGNTVRVFDPRPFERYGRDLTTLWERLEEIARERLNVPTLTPRRSDRLDFHEISVVDLAVALRSAYALGVAEGPPPRSRKVTP